MNLEIIPYMDQVPQLPSEGRHILAQYDNKSVIVYQAYRHLIASFAVKHGYFGGAFKLDRMSWIKPNFLWMMYRSGWGTKQGQERILAIRIDREFFEDILEHAVSTTFSKDLYEDRVQWKRALDRSPIRLQWDPDHDPLGAPLKRRAIQLGLKGPFLEQYSRKKIIEIIDITEFVIEQRKNIDASDYSSLLVPRERVYIPKNQEIYF